MDDEQIIEALDESEKHWVNNEITFAKLDQSLDGSSAGFVAQVGWFEEGCRSDKLCELYHHLDNSYSSYCSNQYIVENGHCPLDDQGCICCIEWSTLQNACYNGLATKDLVRNVATRIQSERAKFN